MRPGHYVALEWGWTPYISNSFKREDNEYSIKNQFFSHGYTITQINDEITRYRKESSGNYDGFAGIIKNFNYKVRPDGGYDCTTELMAGAALLESLTGAQVTKRTGKLIPLEDSFELETQDSLLYYFKSIKANLNKAGDAAYIATPPEGRDFLNENNPIQKLYGQKGLEVKQKILQRLEYNGYLTNTDSNLESDINGAEFIGDRCPSEYKGLYLRFVTYESSGVIKCHFNTLTAYVDDGEEDLTKPPVYKYAENTVVTVIPYQKDNGAINPTKHYPKPSDGNGAAFQYYSEIRTSGHIQ